MNSLSSFLHKLSFKGVVAGIFVKLVSLFVLGISVAVCLDIFRHVMYGIPLRTHDTTAHLAFLLVDAFTGVLAGYVTGRVSKDNQVLNAIVAGVVFNTLGWLIVLFVNFTNNVPLWSNVVEVILVIPTAYCGGVWAKFRKEHPL